MTSYLALVGIGQEPLRERVAELVRRVCFLLFPLVSTNGFDVCRALACRQTIIAILDAQAVDAMECQVEHGFSRARDRGYKISGRVVPVIYFGYRPRSQFGPRDDGQKWVTGGIAYANKFSELLPLIKAAIPPMNEKERVRYDELFPGSGVIASRLMG